MEFYDSHISKKEMAGMFNKIFEVADKYDTYTVGVYVKYLAAIHTYEINADDVTLDEFAIEKLRKGGYIDEYFITT